LVVYEIVTVPAETPVTVPAPFTVATPGALLVQVPPIVASLSDVVAPVHTVDEPVITFGVEFTVTGVFAKQPVGIV